MFNVPSDLDEQRRGHLLKMRHREPYCQDEYTYSEELHSSNVYYHSQSCPHLRTPHRPLNPLSLLRKTGRRKFITTMNIKYCASKLTAWTTDTWVHAGLSLVCNALVSSTTVAKISFLLSSCVNSVVSE